MTYFVFENTAILGVFLSLQIKLNLLVPMRLNTIGIFGTRVKILILPILADTAATTATATTPRRAGGHDATTTDAADAEAAGSGPVPTAA